ncbi:MAG: SpoIIE family protein phosphatase [Sphaerochaetaceae bacterium]|nr:SpoIIE family protein phosphatase [Sphaerochaetaceae bacterium]MDD3941113.1 SpoIIE family protein phosphatase [Sphaerochaetaceae bacterium]
MNGIFIDVDYSQTYKAGQRIGGDVFLQSKEEKGNRVVCTLSDGLGSGVKANVLANLTAHMAHKLSFGPMHLTNSAKIIMNTLPVCNERKISYSTFTIADVRSLEEKGIAVQLVEYDNPPSMRFSRDLPVPFEVNSIDLKREGAFKEETIRQSSFTMQEGDRLIMCTDGVMQSGMGKTFPLGWRQSGVSSFISELIGRHPEISSRELAAAITRKAYALDGYAAKDDITCAVLYVRRPRRTLVVTGPPFTKERDDLLGRKIREFDGRKIVSGGTTAQIVSRLFGAKVSVDLSCWSRDVPPASKMEGMDLVTEGMLTLSKVATALEQKIPLHNMPNDAVRRFVSILLDSDQVSFIVGTKINEAHQDPSIPVEIGIRRTIISRIRQALEQHYLKETILEYI